MPFSLSSFLLVGLFNPKICVGLNVNRISNWQSKVWVLFLTKSSRVHQEPPVPTWPCGSNFLFKRPVWSPFLNWEEGSESSPGHTAGLRHPRHPNGLLLLLVGKGCHLQKKTLLLKREQVYEAHSGHVPGHVPGHHKGRALIVSSSISRTFQRQGLISSPWWPSI